MAALHIKEKFSKGVHGHWKMKKSVTSLHLNLYENTNGCRCGERRVELSRKDDTHNRNAKSTGPPEGISLIQDVTLLEKATLVLTNIPFVAIVDTSL